MDWTDQQRAEFIALWRSARAQRGMKQYQVAAASGLSHGTVSALERGPFLGMRAVDVLRLAHYYGISFDEVARVTLGLPATPTDEHDPGPLAPRLTQAARLLSPAAQHLVVEVLDALVGGLLRSPLADTGGQ